LSVSAGAALSQWKAMMAYTATGFLAFLQSLPKVSSAAPASAMDESISPLKKTDRLIELPHGDFHFCLRLARYLSSAESIPEK